MDNRLKKVQGKKKRDAQIEEEKRKALALVSETDIEQGTAVTGVAEEEVPTTVDLLSSKDEDVIF